MSARRPWPFDLNGKKITSQLKLCRGSHSFLINLTHFLFTSHSNLNFNLTLRSAFLLICGRSSCGYENMNICSKNNDKTARNSPGWLYFIFPQFNFLVLIITARQAIVRTQTNATKRTTCCAYAHRIKIHCMYCGQCAFLCFFITDLSHQDFQWGDQNWF